MSDHRAIKAAAARSHGVLTRSAAIALGATGHFIAAAVIRGAWDEVYPGVYYLNVTPRTWESDVVAAVLAAGATSVASHRTAARIWGLDGMSTAILELTVPFSKEPIPTGVVVHRTRRPLPSVERDGIPVTTVERTLLDLAALLPDRVLERVIQSALHAHLTSVNRLAMTIRTNGGRGVTGTRRFRRVLGLVVDGLGGSIAESEFWQLLSGAPILAPAMQHPLRLPSGDMAYLDFAWPRLMKAIELDGFMAHSTPEQLARDLRRQNQILELGWDLRRFSVRDLRRRPAEIVGEVVRFVSA